MKEMNENQLRGWRPRQPSTALKRRIFAGGRQAAASAWHWNWNCAAPAMVCGLFAVLMFQFNGAGILHEPKPALAMMLGNDSPVAGFSDGAQEVENHVATVTFDWTNHTGFKSSIGFTPTTNFSN